MNVISANDLKTRGVSILEECLEKDPEAIISVHGKNRYVVMPIENYQHIRELELLQALAEVKKDIKEGNYHTDLKKHFKELGID